VATETTDEFVQAQFASSDAVADSKSSRKEESWSLEVIV